MVFIKVLSRTWDLWDISLCCFKNDIVVFRTVVLSIFLLFWLTIDPSSVINMLNWSRRFFSLRFLDFLLVSSFSSSSSMLSPEIEKELVLLACIMCTTDITSVHCQVKYFQQISIHFGYDFIQEKGGERMHSHTKCPSLRNFSSFCLLNYSEKQLIF